MMIFVWAIGFVLLLFCLTALTGAPYVPSHRSDIRELFTDGMKLKESDTVLDIGAGDGVVLIEAAKAGARAIGYEINPLLVLVALWRTRKYRDRISVVWANAWRRVPSEDIITVLYAFGDGRDIKKMYQLAKKQARAQQEKITFVSYAFSVPEIKGTEVGPYMVYEVFTDDQP